MQRLLWLLPAALILPACVTINIYFPAAAAEKAADKIIDDVWQLQEGQQGGQKPPAQSKPAETKPADQAEPEPEPAPAK
ncbi:MAG TPA: hypothetical protein VFF74_01885 [Methylophilaceae bacterium]|nr:hypothetical protein [Methylophilaceae bacterium]